MAISITTGKIPWYGVFGNDIKSVSNVTTFYKYNNGWQDGELSNFNYTPTWTINLGNKEWNFKIDTYSISLYSESGYDTITNLIVKSDEVTGSYDAIEQHTVNINNLVDISETDKVYLRDTGSVLFIRYERDNGATEIIITSTGYIQVNNGTSSRVYTHAYYGKETFFEAYTNCDGCPYNSECTRASSTGTSCYYGATKQKYESSNISVPKSYLLIPSTTTNNYSYTLRTDAYLSGLSFNESQGELYIYNKRNNPCHTVPLRSDRKSGTNYLNVRTSVNNEIKYLTFTKNTSAEKGPLNIRYNGSNYTEYINRSETTNTEGVSGYRVSGQDNLRVFIVGTTTSGAYRYWDNVDTWVFKDRVYVDKIVLRFMFNNTIDRTSSTVPNSSYSNYALYYKTSGAPNTSNWTGSNSEVLSGYSYPSPYRGMYVVKSFTISGYLSEFCIVPYNIPGSASNVSYWSPVSVLDIQLHYRSNGNSYIYNL